MLLLMVSEQVRDCRFCSYCSFYCVILCSSALPLGVFLLLGSSVLIGILSLTSRKNVETCSGFPNLKYGDLLILTIVVLMASLAVSWIVAYTTDCL
jgi:hypothetical protein